ncbi:plastid transcriptionally active 6 [Raphanus sativus]|uniref:PLASTID TRANSCRIPTIONALLY ACTIVE protein 6, chloroplastic n=1 Tax=Raphanus sativus TaxID=3726 RepID=A0A6J0P701_RAPSA|nr:PLASTID TRANSCRIPTIONALLY ACTIVE protein 6, chloroplastic [Raphanus sativus]KAJ4916336.1 plastid transcriptionally active 6 [Raphanus sativus]
MASPAASPSLSLLSLTSKPPPSPSSATHRLLSSFRTNARFAPLTLKPRRGGRSIIARVDDGDADGGGQDEYDMDDEEVEEVDNKKDYDVEYDPLAAAMMAAASGGVGGDGDIAFVQSKSFISTQGWDSEMVVDYRINEEEFHKISLLDCDFFIRKPPDPDNDVYDFREMYVTPPDTDIYSIPRVLAPMPQKYIRCAMSDYGCYDVTEPPIDAPRDPLYKSEREISKVFLTKHYRNRRLNDPEFVLDLEEIYVIDSKTKSITRARVLVTVPGGRKRDRKDDLLVIRDNGNSFKIIHAGERDDPTTVIEREEWTKTREDMEKHLRKLRDFSVSNWF